MLNFTIPSSLRPSTVLLPYPSASTLLQHLVPSRLRSSGAPYLRPSVLLLHCFFITPFIFYSVSPSLSLRSIVCDVSPSICSSAASALLPSVLPLPRLFVLPSLVPSSLIPSMYWPLCSSIPLSHCPSVNSPLYLSVPMHNNLIAI